MQTTTRIVRAVHDILGGGLHAKQVQSLAHAVIGAMHAARAGVASIGRSAAAVRGRAPKHAIKQFDRFLSNERVDLQVALVSYMGFVIGSRPQLTVALDWTEYPDGGHRIALSLVTRHGRATPLCWKTVTAAELTNRRNEHEDELLQLFKFLMPSSVKEVVVLADRAFGDVALYKVLKSDLGFDFVIRFRGCIRVQAESGEARPARDWVPADGRALRLLHAKVTAQQVEVGAVVALKRKAMKDSWLLATSLSLPAEAIVKLYGRRFTIEENFRDEKDWRFGLGSSYVRIRRPARRDRLCLVVALATVLLTMLGQAGEQLGLARSLRANTTQRRTHSLFRQGREYLSGAVGTLQHAVELLFDAFAALLAAQHHSVEIEGVI